jgi:4-amino-4-deoxy-L-arabinose transferase-like glycosyltransferase
VTQTAQPVNQPESVSPARRVVWLLLILATLYLCYFHNLGIIGFVGPDEPRYAWIARDMAETGDWVTPRLYGKPWFEKPVLYYWGAALSFKLFGVSEVAARLPSAIAALLATLAMAWLAWRTYGPETARWVLLLLPTTVGMIGFSHAAATDMPFAGTLTVAMVCAAVIVGLLPPKGQERFAKFLALTLFGVFLGLAVLAKGPAAIILSGGAVLLWAVLTKRWRLALRCLHPLALVSFCLTALPWYILCARRNADFFRVFIIEHNFKRYLTPEFQHIQPFWFYVPVVLIAFVPWAVILMCSAFLGFLRMRRNRQSSSTTIFLLSWALFCLLFFSASKSKLPGYILPAIPAIGLLLARSYLVSAVESEKTLRWLTSVFALVSLPVGVLLIAMGRRFQTSPSTGGAMLVIACVLLAIALANLILGLRVRNFPVAALCVIPVFLLMVTIGPLSHPWLSRDPSGRTLANELTANPIAGDQVYVSRMNRGQLYSLSFYLHRQVTLWNPDQVHPGFLLLASRECQEWVGPQLKCADHPIELRRSGWFVYRLENRTQ